MSSTPPPLPALPASEQLLHPWSWLFVLLAQLRQFLFPLGALMLFGRRASNGDEGYQMVGMVIVAAVLVAISLLRYLTYRYAIGDDRLSVRSGLLSRNRREIPFARIHNVAVQQNLLHRLFGVAEIRLESAGSKHPEAEMRVLRLDQALALEQLVRQHGRGMPASMPAEAGTPGTILPAQDSTVLLALRAADLIRLGLVSNRGMVVVVAAIGAVFQLVPRQVVGDFLQAHAREAAGMANGVTLSTPVWLLIAALFVLLVLGMTRLLSIALAFVQYHRFTLSRADGRLTVERGLFSRSRSSVGERRIQAWSLHQGILQRWLGVQQLKVDIAAGNAEDTNSRSLRELAPIASQADCQRLLQALATELHWPPAQWQSVAPRQAWRLCLPALFWQPVLIAALWQLAGSWALLLLCWLPFTAWRAWRTVAFMGYHVDNRAVMVRGGWRRRWWRMAQTAKVQGLRLQRSPLDRLCGTASLLLDTAGSSIGGPRLRLALLPLARAEQLLEQLSAQISRPRATTSAHAAAPVAQVLADLQPAQPG